MNEGMKHVNPTVAPLTNVALCLSAMDRAVSRPGHLPGMVVFSGPSGWGKSTAAAYVATYSNAYYVECRSSWTKKALLENVLKEMGIVPEKTIYQMTDQVCEQLAASQRPLIVDEMDAVVEKNAVEIIRDIYEGSGGAPLLLIGEDRLPLKLKKWERFHGRILDFVVAQPIDLDDARHLRNLYCKKVTVEDDLLAHICSLAKGSARRICVNLERVQEEALQMGLKSISLHAWGKKQLFTGEAPSRRV